MSVKETAVEMVDGNGVVEKLAEDTKGRKGQGGSVEQKKSLIGVCV